MTAKEGLAIIILDTGGPKGCGKSQAVTTQEWPDEGISKLSVSELKASQTGKLPEL